MPILARKVVVFCACMALSLAVFSGCATAAGKKTQTSTKKSYAQYVTDLKAGNTEIDYFDFRISYTKTELYNPYMMKNVVVDAAFTKLEQGAYDEVLTAAHSIMDEDYTDMDAHYLASVAYKGKGDEKKSIFHVRIFNGLVDSISASGDGLTKDTAMIVINVHEEYVWLGYNGYRRKKQALVEHKGSRLDMMECVHKDSGKEKTFYFNVDLPFEFLGKTLGK